MWHSSPKMNTCKPDKLDYSVLVGNVSKSESTALKPNMVIAMTISNAISLKAIPTSCRGATRSSQHLEHGVLRRPARLEITF